MKLNGYRKMNGGSFCRMNANTINMTNVTNITSVTNVSRLGGNVLRKKNRKRKHENRGSHERKPKLLRFCASGGLLDQDVAEMMSDSEICDGFVEVGSYAAKRLGRTAGRWADDMGRHARGFADNLFGLLGCFFR